MIFQYQWWWYIPSLSTLSLSSPESISRTRMGRALLAGDAGWELLAGAAGCALLAGAAGWELSTGDAGSELVSGDEGTEMLSGDMDCVMLTGILRILTFSGLIIIIISVYTNWTLMNSNSISKNFLGCIWDPKTEKIESRLPLGSP